MENILNRRMFQQPIYAQSGVYVPTIEQIMNFYGGGFTAEGEPKDMEAFQIAIQNANKANTAGLFEDGQPIDKSISSFNFDQKDFMKEQGIDQMYDPIFDTYNTPGGMVKPSEKHEEFLKNYFLEKEKEKFATDKQNISTDEGAQVGQSDLTVYDAANLPSEVAAEIAKKDKMEDEYAQRPLDIANQKELFELLQEAKVKNLAGETEREVSEDENVEMIKRNILQGTNIVEPGTEEFKELSGVDKMKVSDAISAQKRAEVDLTDVSEKGVQNIIDAAGESTETALVLWNDMKNLGGEVAEAANEMLEGWKDAISSGWSDERKKDLKDQIDLIKSKSPDEGEQSLFGVTMEDLEKGGTKVKEWYDDTIFPEVIEGGANIIQNIFGASDVANAELSAEDQLLQDKIIEDQTAEQGDSVDTSIFKEEAEDKETIFGKIVTDLNEQTRRIQKNGWIKKEKS